MFRILHTSGNLGEIIFLSITKMSSVNRNLPTLIACQNPVHTVPGPKFDRLHKLKPSQ